MKKVVFFVATLFIALNVFAQKNAKSANLNLNYGTEIESVGIGGQFTYGFSERFRVAHDFTYFLKRNNTNWIMNLNVHYLFPLNDSKISLYPIAGLTLTYWSFEKTFTSWEWRWNGGPFEYYENTYTSLHMKVGFDLGGGMQYNFSNTFFFRGELKYNIVSEPHDRAVISAGLGFNF